MEPSIPEGFVPWTRGSGPLTAPWEPIYARESDCGFALGFHIREAHFNGRGLLHGGVIATLCDVAMGRCCVAQLQKQGVSLKGLLTTQLSVDYIDKANVGWIEIISRVIHAGHATAITECTVGVDGRIVAHSKARFRIMAP